VRVQRRSARRRGVGALVPALGLALLGAMLAGVAWGAVPLPAATVLGVVAHHLGVPGAGVTWPPAHDAIVWQLRLPRVVAGALVGAALAVSGALFQGLLRNPMADPFVLGISSGAAFGATLVLALPIPSACAGAGLAPAAAFAGALGAAAAVIAVARRGARLPITDLLLAGFAVAAVLGAGTTVLLVLNDRLLLRLRSVFAWIAGGIAVGGWSQLAVAGPLIALGLLLALPLGRWLDAFLLGEEGAAAVGVPVERAKRLAVLVAALLAAAAVTLSGLVGFVGLLVPHAIRLVAGPAHRALLPAAAVGGAAFLVLADLLARTLLAPLELPVGILTALVGGPAFLVLLKRTRSAGGAP
jgi:iron complex transport system permease protein